MRIAVPLIVLLLAGCANFKGIPAFDFALQNQFAQNKQDAANTPIKLKQDWWRDSNDKVLTEIVEKLEQNNLSLEQARFRLLAARETSRSTGFLPSLTLNSDAQYNRRVTGTSTTGQNRTTGYYNAKLDAAWEVPLYNQYQDATDLEEAGIAYAEADLAVIRASVVTEAVRLYADMRRLQKEGEQLALILKSRQQIEKYQRIKLKAGLVANEEVRGAARSTMQAMNDITQTESQLIAAEQQLAALLAMTKPDPAWRQTMDIPLFFVPTLIDTPLDVLRNRPDIRRSEAFMLQAAADLSLTKAEMYPQLKLNGSLAQLGNITGNAVAGRTIQLSGIPSISLPLFDWGQRLANAKRADAKLSEAASAYRETVIKAMTETEEFFSGYRAAQENRKNMLATKKLSMAAFKDTDLLFKRGVADGISLELAKIDSAQAEIASLQAEKQFVTSLASLTKALGGVTATKSEAKETQR